MTIEGWSQEVTFAGASQSIFVGDNEKETVEFSGSYVRTARILGTLTVDGQGEGGIAVALRGPDEREVATEPDGDFVFDGVRAGDYVVEVVGAAEDVIFQSRSRSVNVALGQTVDVSFAGRFLVPAFLEITGIERAGSIRRVDADDLRGEVDVTVRVDPGTENVTRLRAFVADVLLATDPLEGGPIEEATDVEVRLNTADFDGETGEPLLTNGPAVLKVTAETEERGTEAASGTLDVTLRNPDRIATIEPPPSDQGVVSGGHRWFGNQDLHFQVVPVLYSDRGIRSVSLRATTDPNGSGGASLDFGSGSGEAHAVTGPPFVFTASAADNRGLVEDDPQGAGQTIRVVEILDEDGNDVTSELLTAGSGSLTGLYADFAPPRVTSPGADSDVRVGGRTPDGSNHFSGGTFSLRGASDGGVGAESLVTWDASGADGAPIQDVSSIGDLPEREAPDFRLVVRRVADALGNAVDLQATPVAGDNESAGFGVDRTAPELTVARPDPEAGLAVFNVSSAAVRFTASDPGLGGGGVGSQVDADAVSASVVTTGAGSTASGWTLNEADPNYTVDLTGVSEGRYTVTARIPDQALPSNLVDVAWDVALDGTAPSLTLTELPSDQQPRGGTSNIQVELGGTIEDNFQVSSTQSRVEVRRDSDNTSNSTAACGPWSSRGDLYSESSPTEIGRNTVQVGEDFHVVFEVFNPGGTTVTYRYCLWAIAADAARDDLRNPSPNVTRSVTVVDVTWNP